MMLRTTCLSLTIGVLLASSALAQSTGAAEDTRRVTPEPSEAAFTYEDYLEIYGIDLNEDGQVDEADFKLWQENPFIGIRASAAVSTQSWGAIKKAATR